MASNELKQYYDDKLKNVYQCDFNELNADTVKAISNSLSFALWKSNKAFKEFGKACNMLAIEKEETRYKIKFDSVSFLNRWKQRRLSRNANWTIIGVLLCKLGWHNFTCKMQDCTDEFGYVPSDGRMPKVAKCSRCGKNYS